MVTPLLQVLFVAELEAKTTVPPLQNESGPLAVTVGVAGFGLTVMVDDVDVVGHELESIIVTE